MFPYHTLRHSRLFLLRFRKIGGGGLGGRGSFGFLFRIHRPTYFFRGLLEPLPVDYLAAPEVYRTDMLEVGPFGGG